jgi:hypothetical protein
MTYDQAMSIIWAPDLYNLGDVVEASETVLQRAVLDFSDAWQAAYLLTSVRAAQRQYVMNQSTGEAR